MAKLTLAFPDGYVVNMDSDKGNPQMMNVKEDSVDVLIQCPDYLYGRLKKLNQLSTVTAFINSVHYNIERISFNDEKKRAVLKSKRAFNHGIRTNPIQNTKDLIDNGLAPGPDPTKEIELPVKAEGKEKKELKPLVKKTKKKTKKKKD